MRTWGCYFLNLDVEKKRKGLSMRVGHRAHKSTSSPSSTFPTFLSQPILILLLARNFLLSHCVSVNVKKGNGQKISYFRWCSGIVAGQQGRNRSDRPEHPNIFLFSRNLYFAIFHHIFQFVCFIFRPFYRESRIFL